MILRLSLIFSLWIQRINILTGPHIIDDKEILEDELNYGYNTEEFIIEKSDKGDWIINIENYSLEDNTNPTY